jgi:hypothetical protein
MRLVGHEEEVTIANAWHAGHHEKSKFTSTSNTSQQGYTCLVSGTELHDAV